jgi:hypothetical protein
MRPTADDFDREVNNGARINFIHIWRSGTPRSLRCGVFAEHLGA